MISVSIGYAYCTDALLALKAERESHPLYDRFVSNVSGGSSTLQLGRRVGFPAPVCFKQSSYRHVLSWCLSTLPRVVSNKIRYPTHFPLM